MKYNIRPVRYLAQDVTINVIHNEVYIKRRLLSRWFSRLSYIESPCITPSACMMQRISYDLWWADDAVPNRPHHRKRYSQSMWRYYPETGLQRVWKSWNSSVRDSIHGYFKHCDTPTCQIRILEHHIKTSGDRIIFHPHYLSLTTPTARTKGHHDLRRQPDGREV
jgi:hypothetical protein